MAIWGTQSVANRMLSFAYKRFDGKVPEPGPLDDEDRAALGEALALAREANDYTFATLPSAPLRTGSACLDRKAPWFQIKEDRQAAATSVHVTRSVRVVDNLKTLLAPTLCVPHTAQRPACGASTWATKACSLGRSRWSSTRKRPAPIRR